MFSADDQTVKIVCQGEGFADGVIETLKLAPDHRPARELLRLAQLLSIRRLDESGVLAPLDLEAMTNSSWVLNQ